MSLPPFVRCRHEPLGRRHCSSRSERSIARKTYVKLNDGRALERGRAAVSLAPCVSHSIGFGMVGDDRGRDGLTLVRHAGSNLTFALAQPRLGLLAAFFSFPMPGVAGFVGKQSLRNVEHGHLLAGTTSNVPCSFHCRLYGVAANNRHAWTLAALELRALALVSRDGASARLTWSGWRSGRRVRTGRRRRPRCRS